MCVCTQVCAYVTTFAQNDKMWPVSVFILLSGLWVAYVELTPLLFCSVSLSLQQCSRCSASSCWMGCLVSGWEGMRGCQWRAAFLCTGCTSTVVKSDIRKSFLAPGFCWWDSSMWWSFIFVMIAALWAPAIPANRMKDIPHGVSCF